MSYIRLAPVVCLAVASAQPVLAETFLVPLEEPTIAAALGEATAGDTVIVDCGTYYEHDLQVPIGVTLTSATGSPDCVTIDAEFTGWHAMSFGGGTSDSVSVVRGLTITRGNGGPGGGGICCDGADPILENMVITECDASYGGGVYCSNGSPTLRNVVIAHNTASNGGGLYTNGDSYAVLENVTIVANENGGAVCDNANSQANPMFLNCIVAFNNGPGIRLEGGPYPVVQCCDVYGNTNTNYDNFPDQTGTSGNLSLDPFFCEPQELDYTLDASSPCAPANNSCGAVIGALDVACGASPAGKQTWGFIKSIYR